MKLSDVIMTAARYDRGDPVRIHHFIKVWGYARVIGEGEGLSPEDMYALEAAAVLHDIGIHNAEKKYGSSAGKYQEKEGPSVAADILKNTGGEEYSERVCYMVGHHHTYTGIDSTALQILIEADFIVNIGEDGLSRDAALRIRDKYFLTKTGRELLDCLYLAEKYKA